MTTKILFLLPVLCAGVLLAPLGAQQPDEGLAPQDFTHAVTKAEYVIVGRVLGLIDPEPAAAKRKHLEAHWVEVERTLKGYDLTARRLKVHPNTLEWTDGRSYVLFLQEMGNGFFKTIPEPVRTGSPESVAMLVQKLGFGVLPRVQAHMWYLDWANGRFGVMSELIVTVDGRFQLIKPVVDQNRNVTPQRTIVSGNLPADGISNLITRIKATKAAPMADDSPFAHFALSVTPGKVEYLTYPLIDSPELEALLKHVEALAGAHMTKTTRIEKSGDE